MPSKSMGFTGTSRESFISSTRRRSLQIFLQRYIQDHGYTAFHHGDCIGADRIAATLAHNLGYTIIAHPPENPKARAFFAPPTGVILPTKPYLERNRDIVDACDLLLAMPRDSEEELRSGTWAAIRYARKIGRQVEFV